MCDMCVKLRAMMGRCICLFHIYLQRDTQLHRHKNIGRCLQLLDFLQMLMQAILPIEPLYWLVYNGMCQLFVCDSHAFLKFLEEVSIFPGFEKWNVFENRIQGI